MIYPYNGNLSSLEIEVKGTKNEQSCAIVANYLLMFGKKIEKEGYINTNTKSFSNFVTQIHKFPEQWSKIEQLVFGQIENYMIAGSYTFECNDICIGTLKYMREIYSHGKDLKYLNHSKIEQLMNKMEYISAQTAEYVIEKTKERFDNRESKFEDGSDKRYRKTRNSDDETFIK